MFVRMVKPALWAQLEERGATAIAEAAAELVQRGTLVSVYECVTRSEIELVAVALSATRRRQPFHFVAIDGADLEALGVRVIDEPGATGMAEADRLHRDLDLDGDRAARLVARLAERSVRLEAISWRELQAIAKRLRDAGQPIPPASWLLR